MKKILLFLFCCILVQLAFAQDAVLASEQQRFDAMMHRDTQALRHLLAENLTYVHSNSLFETRADFIHSVATGNVVYKTIEKEGETTIRKLGKTTLINGVVHVTGILKEQPFDVHLRYLSVYVKKKHNWKLIAWQTTKIP